MKTLAEVPNYLIVECATLVCTGCAQGLLVMDVEGQTLVHLNGDHRDKCVAEKIRKRFPAAFAQCYPLPLTEQDQPL